MYVENVVYSDEMLSLHEAHRPHRGRQGRPERGPQLPAHEAPEVMRLLEKGQIGGKVVITI
jgi:hypothetical protein